MKSILFLIAALAAGSPLAHADAVTNLGAQAWSFIEKNQPVDTTQFEAANGLPSSTPKWDALEGWKEGVSELKTAEYRNAYNLVVARFSYRIHYFYAGSVDGTGDYLANVRVIPEDINVMWGYKLNASAAITSVVNAGSAANPVAAMEINVKWSIQSLIEHDERSNTVYLRGDGVDLDE